MIILLTDVKGEVFLFSFIFILLCFSYLTPLFLSFKLLLNIFKLSFFRIMVLFVLNKFGSL